MVKRKRYVSWVRGLTSDYGIYHATYLGAWWHQMLTPRRYRLGINRVTSTR